MFDIRDLPRDPSSAFKEIISKLLSKCTGTATVAALKQKGNPLYSDLVIGTTAAIKAAERMTDQQIAEAIISNLRLRDDDNLSTCRERFQTALELAISNSFDEHFLDEEAVEEFDQAKVPPDQRDEIRAFLENAKNLAATAAFLDDRPSVRRSFIHKINLAENELFKEAVGIQAFFAAAYEGARLVRRYGEAAKPLAEAVETARTKTERHVEAYERIEAEEKPKQLPKPTGEK